MKNDKAGEHNTQHKQVPDHLVTNAHTSVKYVQTTNM
jgi:hypothetical protein